MDEFIRNLKQSNFSQQDIDLILQHGEVEQCKKGEIFIAANDNNRKIGFLQSGIMSGWYIDEKGVKRHSQFYFVPDNYVVMDYESYLRNQTPKLTIEAIEDVKIFVIAKSVIKDLMAQFPNFLEAEKKFVEQRLIEAQRIITLLQSFNAEERIRLIKNEYPELFAKIPYSYLASFLGIHRNTFYEALKRV